MIFIYCRERFFTFIGGHQTANDKNAREFYKYGSRMERRKK